MRQKGKIKAWDDNKGCGFIQPLIDGKDIFFHISGFPSRRRRPEVGQLVTYSLGQDARGRVRAEQIAFSADQIRTSVQASNKGSHFSIWLASLFLVFMLLSVMFSHLPVEIVFLYLGLSVATYVLYWMDKQQAKNGGRRTPESTLHLCALLGGWPGAVFAQQTLRHKSKKESFRNTFWVTCIVNCAAFAWLITEQGQQLLQVLGDFL